MSKADRFKKKVVIVTGAAQGIGRGVALQVAAEGGKVLAVDRSDLVNEVVEEIKAAKGKAVAFQADLTSAASMEKLFADTIAATLRRREGAPDDAAPGAPATPSTPATSPTDTPTGPDA